ncbi:DUF1630-domain-containing protein [Sistotremastrum niveocremeum HHB9708]|uniref:DUF1630-domain-containing protein n=1 Tax=Sistotremastrum niveocremeum HHB9708 TaxID=1314777 RepID=A0A164VKB9_9AGAM|nr:DUF1630-domain-containing protein [Sistotremastrum niveocremeum HHB9708]
MTLPRVYGSQKRRSSTAPYVEALEPAQVVSLRRWILGVAIIDFDIDLGPVFTSIYPPLNLASIEKENITFSSLPDTSTTNNLTTSHSFRIRDSRDAPESQLEELSVLEKPPSIDGFLYGYVTFLQVREPTSKRGYVQRSFTVLSYHPLPALFTEVSSNITASYGRRSSGTLKKACEEIANWPDPSEGILSLNFCGTVLEVEMPTESYEAVDSRPKLRHAASVPRMVAVAPSLTPSLVNAFSVVLPSMWSLWECLVLNEPLAIFAPSADVASSAVWWLEQLLHPLPFVGDYRPYFTIHDRDFTALVNKQAPKSGLLIGCTNPLLHKLCSHWPHTVHLSATPHLRQPKGRFALATSNLVEGFHSTTHNRYTSKDRPLLKKLEDMMLSGTNLKMETFPLLKRHFSARATEFLAPFNRYLTTLLPAHGSSPINTSLKKFETAKFMASLKAHGSPLPFRTTAKRNEFYERWMRTPAFGRWLAQQDEYITSVLRNPTAGKRS